MGDEDLKKKHAFYGSAGMAAAGMIPIVRAPKPEEEKQPATEENAADSATEADTETEQAPPADEPIEVEAPESGPPLESAEPEAPEEAAPNFISAAILSQSASPGATGVFDHAFERINGLRLVSVSDGNSINVEETRSRTGARTGYANYLEMLEKEKPEVVAVSAADSKLHFPMAKAALQSGAHVCCDSPFTVTLKEADELLTLSAEKGRKFAVANPLLCDPTLIAFHAAKEDLIGELLEIRLFGNSDETAGGEDLLRSGIPLFEVANWFAGESNFCTASVEIEGAPAIAEDAEMSASLGLLLGDSIRAEFFTASGIVVTYVSDQRLGAANGPMGAEFIGSKGRARLFTGDTVVISTLQNPNPADPTRNDTWQIWSAPESGEKAAGTSYREVIVDFVASLENDRTPICSAEKAIRALEMAHSVWQAGSSMKRAYLPLTNRIHPLSEDSL